MQISPCYSHRKVHGTQYFGCPGVIWLHTHTPCFIIPFLAKTDFSTIQSGADFEQRDCCEEADGPLMTYLHSDISTHGPPNSSVSWWKAPWSTPICPVVLSLFRSSASLLTAVWLSLLFLNWVLMFLGFCSTPYLFVLLGTSSSHFLDNSRTPLRRPPAPAQLTFHPKELTCSPFHHFHRLLS